MFIIALFKIQVSALSLFILFIKVKISVESLLPWWAPSKNKAEFPPYKIMPV